MIRRTLSERAAMTAYERRLYAAERWEESARAAAAAGDSVGYIVNLARARKNRERAGGMSVEDAGRTGF